MKHALILILTAALVSSATLLSQIPLKENKSCGRAGLITPHRHANSMVPNVYDIHHIQFNWDLDPSQYWISGSVKTLFTSLVNNLNAVEFELSPGPTIDSVYAHGMPAIFSFSNGIISISLPQSLALNAADTVQIWYHGAPFNSGFGSFNASDHNGTPVLWTLSEPYGARDWWPCKQDLNDKADSIDLFITVPSGNIAVSNGLLISEMPADNGAITFHWQHKYPIAAYLIAVGVTNYSHYQDIVLMPDGNPLPVDNYVYPEELTSAQTGTALITQIIPYFNNLLIPYPFALEKYGHCRFNWGGGMEHQTISFVVNYSPDLLAHECAHQWFGDHVTCGSWHDIWLNEGFATYLTNRFRDELNPGMGAVLWDQSRTNVLSAPDGSVYCDDTTSVDRIFSGRLSYDKGSWLLRMLQWQLGDAMLMQGLRDYLNDPLLAGGYARASNLKTHLENASGTDLSDFFNQWYLGQGYPNYSFSWFATEDSTHLAIYQTTSHSSVAFYSMPLPIYFSDGIHDTTVVVHHQWSGQTFDLALSFTPTSMQFDPEHWILWGESIVGINEQMDVSDITVFPNPASETIHVQRSNPAGCVVKIFDSSGRTILSEKSNNQLINIPVSNIQPGSYHLQILGGNNIETRKIVILHD
jgi:aminopeptidase N